METLFPLTVDVADLPPIPGLRYLPEYISLAEEQALVEAIDRQPWNTEWRRRRQPYGGDYGKAGSAPPIPAWGRDLAARLLAENISSQPFDHMLVNEYLPGQGIALHRDYSPFGRRVVSLSLLSDCVMDFRSVQGPEKLHSRLLLERRSLLVLSDDARYLWEHGIAARRKDHWQGVTMPRSRRLSITFRFRESSGTSTFAS